MFRREITPAGERSLKKLSLDARRALLDASVVLEQDPFRAGEKLHGQLSFLFSFHFKHDNVKYRMAYTINVEQKLILIHFVGMRGGFYERLLRTFQR